MELIVGFETLEPPSGWTHPSGDHERQRFDGWLELIRSIEQFVQRLTLDAATSGSEPGNRDGTGAPGARKE